MSPFPYRVKSLRTHTTISVVDEHDSVREEARLIVWRVSDREFRVHRYAPAGGERLVSQAPSKAVCCIDISQVRDWKPYLPGDTIPWPECTTPPECVDSEEKMLSALTAPNGGEKKPAKAARV